MELDYLRNILSDLRKRFDQKFSSDAFHLRQEILLLNRDAKHLIKKKVQAFEYNVGALSVLQLLNSCNVLSMSEYLQGKPDEEVQGIIGDLIDLENAHELLADVVKASSSSEVLHSHFQHCLKQYTVDVVTRPELIKHEFFSSIKRHISEDVFRDLIAMRFAEEVLLITHNEVSEISDVITHQKSWNSEADQEKFKVFKKILGQLDEDSEVLAKLLLQHLHSGEVNWFFLLILLRQVSMRSKGFDDLKQFLKICFKRFSENSNVVDLMKMLIVARQVFHYATDPVMTYKVWVKQTIGEMNYQLKCQKKFTQALEALQSLIFFEVDLEVLEIHAQTPIASPRGSNSLVLEYKQQLKTRIASLKDPDAFMDLT